MLRLMLGMLVAGVTGSAAAAWVEVGKSDTTTVYADSTTIRRSGTTVKMWGLVDFKRSQRKEAGTTAAVYLAEKIQLEFDCREERYRRLFTLYHSGNMGNGETVLSDIFPGNWDPVAPGSFAEMMAKLACGKR